MCTPIFGANSKQTTLPRRDRTRQPRAQKTASASPPPPRAKYRTRQRPMLSKIIPENRRNAKRDQNPDPRVSQDKRT
ncbi:hypothetical protein L209DRAFT_754915 [Thermothelomyces heterothallicus CBS 203.75]